VGDDFPLTKGFAQEGASAEMSLRLAIIAVTVSTSARTPLILRYITASAALIVGVVNLLVFGFVGFVDRVIRTDFRHCENPFRSSIVRPSKQLLAFRSFAHDPQGILAAVYGLALMGIELGLNIGILELSVAPFAYADGRRTLLHDPQFACRHDCSLAHLAGRA
jgi:hypothetical protein